MKFMWILLFRYSVNLAQVLIIVGHLLILSSITTKGGVISVPSTVLLLTFVSSLHVTTNVSDRLLIRHMFRWKTTSKKHNNVREPLIAGLNVRSTNRAPHASLRMSSPTKPIICLQWSQLLTLTR
jgi:hypothetical protein